MREKGREFSPDTIVVSRIPPANQKGPCTKQRQKKINSTNPQRGGARTCFSCNSARRLLSASGTKLAASRPLTAVVSMLGRGTLRWSSSTQSNVGRRGGRFESKNGSRNGRRGFAGLEVCGSGGGGRGGTGGGAGTRGGGEARPLLAGAAGGAGDQKETQHTQRRNESERLE